MQGWKQAIRHLALAALLLRALLPMGWMPGTPGQSLLVICTMDGPVQQAAHGDHGKQAPDDGQRAHEECPFAAAPHLAPPATVAAIAAPASFARLFNPPADARAPVRASVYQPQSPRAPPLTA